MSRAGSDAGSAAKPNGGDDAIDTPAIQIKGLFLEPRGMDGLGVPAAPLKKGATVDSEKKAYGLAKDSVTKQAHAVNAASELFRQSLKLEGDAKKQMLGDARQILRDAVATAGAKADETALELLGRYELLLDDPASAEKVWAQLLTVAPTDKAAPNNRAWWTLSLLKQGKNADALALLKDQLGDKSPVVAYAQAWAKWRTGDGAGAWKSITQAAQPAGIAMDGSADRDAVKGDLIVLATRTPTQPRRRDRGASSRTTASSPRISTSCCASSRRRITSPAAGPTRSPPTRSRSTLKAPANDRVSILFEEAQLSLPLDAPADVAKYSKARDRGAAARAAARARRPTRRTWCSRRSTSPRASTASTRRRTIAATTTPRTTCTPRSRRRSTTSLSATRPPTTATRSS